MKFRDDMSAFSDGPEHQAIMAAGWSYRANDRGWVIYRDPQTGMWHTRSDAIAIVSAVKGPTKTHRLGHHHRSVIGAKMNGR